LAAGQRIYLDHNATAPIAPGVAEAMCAALEMPGNPSSPHQEGRAVRAGLDAAARRVADVIGAKAAATIFTSGGTEGAAMLLDPDWVVKGERRRLRRLFVLSTDHACLLSGGSFASDEIVRLPVDGDGVIDLAALDRQLSEAPDSLVAVQHANNETGTIQPVQEIAALSRRRGALAICDCVQSLGKIPVDIRALGVDALFVSAHKIGGPKGVGAVLLADASVTPARPLIAGGGQQRGYRAGTENVPGIVGFAAAVGCVAARLAAADTIAALRDRFEAGLAPDAVVFGREADRLPNTSLFALPALAAETNLIALDLAGFAVSSGAACSSGKVKRSHVLAAMGVADDLAACAIRMSIGPETTEDEIDRFLDAMADRIAASARISGNDSRKAA
jgi:cysteine desulfurase